MADLTAKVMFRTRSPELMMLERDLEGLGAIRDSAEFSRAAVLVVAYDIFPSLEALHLAMRALSEGYEFLKVYKAGGDEK